MKRKTDNFNKFFNKKRNSAVKEEFRQEKKAAKKERKEAIEKHFEDKRRARFGPSEDEAPAAQPAYQGKGARADSPASKGARSATPAATTEPGGKGKSAPAGAKGKPATNGPAQPYDPNLIPLNKYIAHGGICSRRDAAELIRLGNVSVNGQIVTEPGTKVSPSDTVQANGKKVTMSRNFVYILLNKPKDYITTTEDPQGRRTVLDLIKAATTERVFPVGRLDRNTSGVLLFTNDGDLAQKLTHPSHEIKKIYHVTLDKPLIKADFDKIINGEVILEDGPSVIDVLAYADARDKSQIGLEIHSGRNRIVRRTFEHLGYDVRGLDRVTYAGLTKKNVQRGMWRLLTEKEIRILKYLNSSFKGSPAKGAKATLRDQKAKDVKDAKAGKTATHLKAFDEDEEDNDGWVDPSTTAWDAPEQTQAQPNAAAKREGQKDIRRYAKAQEAKKLPGKKKPPTLADQADSDGDTDFPDIDSTGNTPPSRGKFSAYGKSTGAGRSSSDGRSSGRGKSSGGEWSSGGSEKPSGRGKSSGGGRSFSGPGDRSAGSGRSSSGAGKPARGGKVPYSGRVVPESKGGYKGKDFSDDNNGDAREGRPARDSKPPFRGKSGGGFKGKSEGGYKGKSSDGGCKGKSTGGYKGKNFSPDKDFSGGRESSGEKPPYRGKSEGGYKGRSEGASRDSKPPFRGKSEGGYKGKSEGGYKGKAEGGYKGKSSGGFKGKSEGGYKGRSGPGASKGRPAGSSSGRPAGSGRPSGPSSGRPAGPGRSSGASAGRHAGPSKGRPATGAPKKRGSARPVKGAKSKGYRPR